MKKIFRLAVVFAIAGAALLTGCTKDYSVEIAELQAAVDKLNGDIAALQTQIQQGDVLKSVEPITGGVRVTTNSGKSWDIVNGENGKDGKDGKDGDEGKEGKAGAAGKSAYDLAVEKGYKGTLDEWLASLKGEKGNDGENGKPGNDGAPGANGKSAYELAVEKGYTGTLDEWLESLKGEKGQDGTVITMSEDGYWVVNGEKTENKWQAKDGEDGADGVSWNVVKKEDGLWFIPTPEDENHKPYLIAKTGGLVSAVWGPEGLTLYGEGFEDGKVVISTTTPLKSLAFVPDTLLDGLGLASVKLISYNGALVDVANYKFQRVETTKNFNYLASAASEASYRLNPQNIDVTDYDWSIIKRDVYTKATAADVNNFITIDGDVVKNGSFLEVNLAPAAGMLDALKNNKWIKPKTGQDNILIALRANCKTADPNGQAQEIVSDYQYVDTTTVNFTYSIIEKKKYEAQPQVVAKYKTGYIDIDPNNVVDVKLAVNGEENLHDYVETYANEIADLASCDELGLEPKYEFYLCGKDNDGKYVIDPSNAAEAPYCTEDKDKTNQNEFIVLSDGKIKVNTDFVSASVPAIGRTPLIYVRSYVGDDSARKYLADAFILVQITGENQQQPSQNPLGWLVFLKHSVVYENLGANVVSKPEAPVTGTGEFWALKKLYKDADNKEFADLEKISDNNTLEVVWDEVNKYVLNTLVMTYETFGDKYDMDPQIILNADGTLPTALPAKVTNGYKTENFYNEFANYYLGADCGFTSPTNWKQSTNIANVAICDQIEKNKDFKVFVLFEAKDNYNYPDVIFEFDYKWSWTAPTPDHHTHEFQILDWELNHNYILGPQNKLVSDNPGNAYYGNEEPKPYTTYGAVSIKGQVDVDRSAFIEHFEGYYVKANTGSNYKFEIVNYKNTIVDIELEANGKGSVSYENGYAVWSLTGAELKGIAEDGDLGAYVKLVSKYGIDQGKDILVKVTETCNDAVASATMIIDDPTEKVGYYYVVFDATTVTVEGVDVELVTKKEINDYVLASELVVIKWNGKAVDTNNNPLFVLNATGDKIVPTQVAIDDYDVDDQFVATVEINAITPAEKYAEHAGRLAIEPANTNVQLEMIATVFNFKEMWINWWNSGTVLVDNQELKYEATVKYTVAGEEKTADFTGKLTLVSSANSVDKNPNH